MGRHFAACLDLLDGWAVVEGKWVGQRMFAHGRISASISMMESVGAPPVSIRENPVTVQLVG